MCGTYTLKLSVMGAITGGGGVAEPVSLNTHTDTHKQYYIVYIIFTFSFIIKCICK